MVKTVNSSFIDAAGMLVADRRVEIDEGLVAIRHEEAAQRRALRDRRDERRRRRRPTAALRESRAPARRCLRRAGLLFDRHQAQAVFRGEEQRGFDARHRRARAAGGAGVATGSTAAGPGAGRLSSRLSAVISATANTTTAIAMATIASHRRGGDDGI